MDSEERLRATRFQEENRIEKSLRPKYHATPPTGWMNDPNGFSIYRGKVHLFYQYHPYKDIWGPMHWGHCVSADYLTWEDYPVALAPDEEYDATGCFSGSIVEKDGEQVVLYTGAAQRAPGESVPQARQQQCLARGDGINYIKSPLNPVIPSSMLPAGFRINEFRDPKVFLRNGRYWMVTAAMDDEGTGHVLLYVSDDLEHWEFYSDLLTNDARYGTMVECPDLFERGGKDILVVSATHMKNSGPGFHDGYGVIVYIGQVNWETGTMEIESVLPVDQGADYYAAQSLETSDHRRVLIAWMQAWHNFIKPDEQKWHGMMTIPREVSFENGRLLQKPVRELESARANPVRVMDAVVQEEESVEFPEIRGRSVELILTPTSTSGGKFTVTFAKGPDSGITFLWDPEKHVMEVDRVLWGLSTERGAKDAFRHQVIWLPEEASLPTMRFLIDTTSVELFIGRGEVVFSTTYYAPADAQAISFGSSGRTEVSIVKYDIHPDVVYGPSEF